MKILFSFLFTLSLSFFINAQTTVTGKITDSDGQPIPSASVTIEEQGKDAIMAFSISNSKGEYKVTFTSPDSNVDLKIKAFNQKPLFKSIKNVDCDYRIDGGVHYCNGSILSGDRSGT